jgi:hypothetical protein
LESGKAFDRLDEAAPPDLKTKWLARERIAQSSRMNDPVVMDEYEINIKKGTSTSIVSIEVNINIALSTEQKGDRA